MLSYRERKLIQEEQAARKAYEPTRKRSWYQKAADYQFFLWPVTSIVVPVLVSVLAQVVGANWNNDDVIMNYTLPDIAKLGEGQYIVNFAFANLGQKSVIIDDLGIIELDGSGVKLEQCDTPNMVFDLETSDQTDRWIMKHGQLPNGLEMSYWRPDRVFIDGRLALSTTAIIAGGASRVVQTVFHPDRLDFAQRSGVVVCVTVRYLIMLETRKRPFALVG
jgi:hypothetical protein